MNISNSSGVQSAVQAAQAVDSDAVAILVLKKALESESAVAQTLLQALPTAAPALAVSGSVGTRVNTFA